MSDSSSPNKIQRFAPTQWLSEVSIEETEYFSHHYFESQSLQDDQIAPAHNSIDQQEKSLAAVETAHLQAQINAKRKNKPISLMSDKKDILGHTAFLQHQIDLRRKQ